MKPRAFKNIISKLRKGDVEQAYFLQGDSNYLKEKFITTLKLSLVPELADFNYTEFWGDELNDKRNLFDEIISLPAMAEKRIVVVYNANSLRKSIKKEIKKFDIPDSTCLVISAEKRSYYFQNFKVLKLYTPWDSEVKGWVFYLAKKHDIRISKKAVPLFTQKVGKSLSNIDGELEKLRVAKGRGSRITVKDVKTYVSKTRQTTIFQFIDSFGSKEYQEALQLARELQDFGEYPTRLIYWLAKRTKKLMLYKLLKDKGYKKKKITKLASIKSFKYRDISTQATNYKLEELREIISFLHDVDLKIKRGKLPADIAITYLMGRIME